MLKIGLIILDGVGFRANKTYNALKSAKMPVFNRLLSECSSTLLEAAGPAVGLERGVMGNSEVGHLTIGAGRIVDSDLVRINRSIKDGSFFKNKVLLEAMNHVKKNNHRLHLMGLLSDAGVHAHIDHLFALLRMARMHGITDVYVHVFLDGRDSLPTSGVKYVQRLIDFMKREEVGELATMMGRYYAMDRDNRWNREHHAYEAMVHCVGRTRYDPVVALKEFYAQGETDEFVKPTILLNRCVVEAHDSVVFFNFRSDRARELTRAFVWGRFKEFKRKEMIDLRFVTLTQYDSLVKVPVAFAPIGLHNTLGEVISKAGVSQLRIAETEKWAHVTFFFNGLCECTFAHEKREHIASRKVATYDLSPQMRVQEIAEKMISEQEKHDLFVVNFASGDMVGHTGNFKATVKSLEVMDQALGDVVRGFKGILCITADHGNCEDMTAKWVTSHTGNDVPFILVGPNIKLRSGGGLCDVAPTILDLVGLRKPREMTGRSLIVR